jgi:hypothetical protein
MVLINAMSSNLTAEIYHRESNPASSSHKNAIRVNLANPSTLRPLLRFRIPRRQLRLACGGCAMIQSTTTRK